MRRGKEGDKTIKEEMWVISQPIFTMTLSHGMNKYLTVRIATMTESHGKTL